MGDSGRTLLEGVLLVAVIVSANRTIVPIMFGYAQAEDGASVSRFIQRCEARFNKKFVQMADQGSGIVSEVNSSSSSSDLTDYI